MRILFLHPGDRPSGGQRATQTWDRVIDLGFAGEETYQRWSAHFGCPVGALPTLDIPEMRKVRASLFSALGRLTDSQGLDWWELIGIRFHESLERIAALRKAAPGFNAEDELFFSRPCFHAQVAAIVFRGNVRCLARGKSSLGAFRRLSFAPFKFGFAQFLQIAGDKYDAGYRVRRLTAPRVERTENPITLLPSAYVNASRTALAYAESLPDQSFLLVTTRRSGRLLQCPKNVRVERLASYAPGRAKPEELQFLLSTWSAIRKEIAAEPYLSILSQIGLLNSVPHFLQEGLAIRDAWLRVFSVERVRSVLCTDDSNPYTRIPLLIASRRNLPAIACHHGALDGRHLIKRCHPEITLLAKGEMERDYLTARCGIREEQVQVGAPAIAKQDLPRADKDAILFFSEPYELSGGRCQEFYGETLPRLMDLATANRRRLILKVHPQESRREREALARSVLSSEQLKHFQITDGVLRDDLLNRAWVAVTVMSTTAVECALHGIPVFLCRWLDHSNYGYLGQFARFGVGVPLMSARDIDRIPEYLDGFAPPDRCQLLQPISRERLQELITGSRIPTLAAAG